MLAGNSGGPGPPAAPHAVCAARSLCPTLECMSPDFVQLAMHYQAQLSGYLVAHLTDRGIADGTAVRRGLGSDDDNITVPVWSDRGISFFERWSLDDLGMPLDDVGFVSRYPADRFREQHDVLVFAEGIYECLIFESMGIPAVCATGTGLYFKRREWVPLLRDVSEILVAFRSGERQSRRKFVLSREEVISNILIALPQARRIEWPISIRQDEGAFEYFVRDSHEADDFWRL